MGSLDASNYVDTDDVIYRTIVANTYKWMDSHDDVHIPGLFNKSLDDNKNGVFFFHDHIFQLDAKVGVPLKIYEQSIPWTDLGVNRLGNTIALMADSEIRKALNPSIFDQYKNNEINQHSIKMRYIDIFLCINDPMDPEHYANWNKYFVDLGNMPKILEQGYFWAVTQAGIKEYSCVTAGSNELTPTLEFSTENKEKPDESTSQEPGPDESTQQSVITVNLF